jgi:hypothetical protein
MALRALGRYRVQPPGRGRAPEGGRWIGENVYAVHETLDVDDQPGGITAYARNPGRRVEAVVQPVPKVLNWMATSRHSPIDGQEVIGEQSVEPVRVAAQLGFVEGPPELKNVV